MSQPTNVSDDLLWQVVRSNNAYLIKRKTGGGAYFSRDPFNLLNKHSRTHAGFVNSKAVSVQPSGEKGVSFSTKKEGKSNTPAKSLNTHKFKSGRSNQKVYKAISDNVGQKSYRSDLNLYAIQRASAVLDSQRAKADAPEKKTRGAKARKTQA
ncbi:hypothetical protein LTR64_007237 [Lithohypha guttulata]|uniref:Ribosomal eL28/Mak16 domain-containing protein n=1 Tax=Lithohypha guttulata TaxID=1690604 RepID=A0AAN7T6X2_9EURO|nr:hypothetical protein LTR51_004206 [Lithohypha guttulata]KAK5090814.1 hypothetical protein LTR05_000991 [Lithohypha guttulata]